MTMYINLLIVFFLFLIMRYMFLKIQNCLEGFCSTPGNSKNACMEIANSKNTAAMNHSENLMKEIKMSITNLLSNVSKSANESEKNIKNNIKGIQTNISNNNKVKDAITPDK